MDVRMFSGKDNHQVDIFFLKRSLNVLCVFVLQVLQGIWLCYNV